MNKIVMVPIPVSPEAAEALGDDARRERIGKLVSEILVPGVNSRAPLAAMITGFKDYATRDGVTDTVAGAEF